MKAGIEAKCKFVALKKHLKVPLWQVKGILQSIWDFTIENAPRGDIGRFTDGEICETIEYGGNAAHLIDLLVNTRWLDRCAKNRLVVHDWKVHAPEFIQKRMDRAVKRGESGWAEDDGGIETADNGRQRQTTADNVGVNPTQPNPTQPNPTTAGEAAAAVSEKTDDSLDRIRMVYPPEKRGSRKMEAEAWDRLAPKPDAEAVIEAIRYLSKRGEWLKDDGRWIPRLHNFLTKRQWEGVAIPRRRAAREEPGEDAAGKDDVGKEFYFEAPAVKDGANPWDVVAVELKRMMRREEYGLYVRPMRLVGGGDGRMMILAPDGNCAGWVENGGRGRIEDAIAAVNGRGVAGGK